MQIFTFSKIKNKKRKLIKLKRTNLILYKYGLRRYSLKSKKKKEELYAIIFGIFHKSVSLERVTSLFFFVYTKQLNFTILKLLVSHTLLNFYLLRFLSQ